MDTKSIDQAITELQDRKREWARLPVAEKRELFTEVRAKANTAAQRWVDAAIEAKGLPSDSPLTGEEWASGPWALISTITEVLDTLGKLDSGDRESLKPQKVRTRSDGQVVAKVFPASAFDWLLLNGITAEVWMEPGVTAQGLRDTMAVFYDQKDPEGAVALVLGAGNISSITPLDVLYKMVAEGQVCVVKMNPVNQYLGPIFEEIFGEMIQRGFVRFVYGGVDVGAYLTDHPGVEEIHMTGSDRTFNAIVFGPGEEGEKRREMNQPINTRPISAELGGVGPTIVLPGPWSAADIQFQAEHVATQKLHNTGCNCVASQLLILPEAWDQADDFLEVVKEVLGKQPVRKPYYPGMGERQAQAVQWHPEAELLDERAQPEVPKTMICGLDPNATDEPCFSEEFFGATYAQTALPGATALEYLNNAVTFCNEKLAGTLGVNLIIHPVTIKELGPNLEEAIAALRYGSIGINSWVALGYLLARATWGAFPGHPDSDIQSGRGVVHNTLLFDRAQKSVVYAPFMPFPRAVLHGEFHMTPKPPWFVTNRTADVTSRRLTRFAANPGWLHLPGIFAAALRG